MRALRITRPFVAVVEVTPRGQLRHGEHGHRRARREPHLLQVDSQLLSGWIDVEAESARQPRHHPVLSPALLELELGQFAAEIHLRGRGIQAAAADPCADDGSKAPRRRALAAGEIRRGGVPLARPASSASSFCERAAPPRIFASVDWRVRATRRCRWARRAARHARGQQDARRRQQPWISEVRSWRRTITNACSAHRESARKNRLDFRRVAGPHDAARLDAALRDRSASARASRQTSVPGACPCHPRS